MLNLVDSTGVSLVLLNMKSAADSTGDAIPETEDARGVTLRPLNDGAYSIRNRWRLSLRHNN